MGSETPTEEEDRELALLEAARCLELGNIASDQAQYSDAQSHLETALQLSREHKDSAGEARALSSLGELFFQQRQYPEALDCLNPALSFAERTGDRKLQANCLGKVGWIFHTQGQHSLGLEHASRALEIATEIGDKFSAGVLLSNLADMHSLLSKNKEAVALGEQALALLREVGDSKNEARVLSNLAGDHYRLGEHDRAISLYKQALATHQSIGNRKSIVLCLLGLALIQSKHAQWAETKPTLDEALALSQSIANSYLIAICQGRLADVYKALNQPTKAVSTYREAVQICREEGYTREACGFMGNLGTLLLSEAEPLEGERLLREAIASGTEVFPLAAGSFSGVLALHLAGKNQLDEAFALLASGEPLICETPTDYAVFLSQKGQVQRLAGQITEARSSLKLAREQLVDQQLSETSEAVAAVRKLAELLATAEAPRDEQASKTLADAAADAAAVSAKEPETASDVPLSEADAEEREFALLTAEQKMELGQIELDVGNYTEAQICLTEALNIFEEHEDRSGMARAYRMLGRGHQLRAETDQAMDYYEASLEIARELNSHTLESLLMSTIGSCLVVQGRIDEAIETLENAIAMTERLGNQRLVGANQGNLANAWVYKGDSAKAAHYYKLSLAVSTTIGDRRTEGINRGNLATCLSQLGRPQEAIEAFEEAIAIHRELQNSRSESICLTSLAKAYLEINDSARAESLLREAIALSAMQNPSYRALQSSTLAVVLAHRGSLAEARSLLTAEQSTISRASYERLEFLCNCAKVALLDEAPEEARGHLQSVRAQMESLKLGPQSATSLELERLEAQVQQALE